MENKEKYEAPAMQDLEGFTQVHAEDSVVEISLGPDNFTDSAD